MKLNSTLSLFPSSSQAEGYSVFSTVVDFLFGAHKPFTQTMPRDGSPRDGSDGTTNDTQVPVIQLVPMKPSPEQGTNTPLVSYEVDFVQTKKWSYISPMISDNDVLFWRKATAQRVINGTLVSHPHRHQFVDELNELLKKHQL